LTDHDCFLFQKNFFWQEDCFTLAQEQSKQKEGRGYEESHPTGKKGKGSKNYFEREEILWSVFIL
jgi:hypothetical protein